VVAWHFFIFIFYIVSSSIVLGRSVGFLSRGGGFLFVFKERVVLAVVLVGESIIWHWKTLYKSCFVTNPF
jgi:hypothetical protein